MQVEIETGKVDIRISEENEASMLELLFHNESVLASRVLLRNSNHFIKTRLPLFS